MDRPAEPDDDLRRADVRASGCRSRACARSSASASSCSAASASVPSQTAGRRVLARRSRASISREHVVATTLPEPAGTRELQALVSRLAATPLDPRAAAVAIPPRRPSIDGGSALIARIHHCYADGIALVRVMLSMTDARAEGPPAMPFAARSARELEDDDDPLPQLLAPLSGVREVCAQSRRAR